MPMDVYQRAVSRAVKIFMWDAQRSADFMALRLSITRGAFYAKLSGRRKWNLEDLSELQDLGIKLPPLSLGKAAK